MIYPHDIPICWLNPLNPFKLHEIPTNPAIPCNHNLPKTLQGIGFAWAISSTTHEQRPGHLPQLFRCDIRGFLHPKIRWNKTNPDFTIKGWWKLGLNQQRLRFNYSNLAMNIVGFNRPEYYLADKTGINPTRSLILPANIVTSNDSVAKQLGISSPNMSLRWQKWLSLGLMTVPRSPDQ